MSKKTEESLLKFNDWKKDLEWRAEQWQHDHANDWRNALAGQKPEESRAIQRYDGGKSFVMPNMVVSVFESSTIKGQWIVSVNKKVMFMSEGPLAHMKALKFADGYLNAAKGDTTSTRRALPEPCVFCGGRYLHRLECPDFKKDGPERPPSGGSNPNPTNPFWFEDPEPPKV